MKSDHSMFLKKGEENDASLKRKAKNGNKKDANSGLDVFTGGDCLVGVVVVVVFVLLPY